MTMTPERRAQGSKEKRTDKAQPEGYEWVLRLALVSCTDFFWNENLLLYQVKARPPSHPPLPLLRKPRAFRLAEGGQLVGRRTVGSTSVVVLHCPVCLSFCDMMQYRLKQT